MDKIETHILDLRSGDAVRQQRAARALGDIGDALYENGTSQQSQTRQEFCNTVVPALVEALEDEDEGVRSDAAFVLGKISDALLQSQNYQEFCNTVVPALVEALKDEAYCVRWSAAVSLGKINDISAGPALVKALGDEDANVRWRAVEGLGKIGDASTVPALVEALGDEILVVRRQAAEALGKIVDNCETIEALESYEKDLQEGFAALKKECHDKDRIIEAKMRIAKLMKTVSEKKNELASKRDVLLDAKPKPPERGKIYQTARRVRYG